VWRGYSRISYVHLPEQRRLGACGLYFRSIRVFALPRFCGVPEYLSRRFAKYFYDVVLRNILWGVFETNEVPLFVACIYAPVG
jgi:hypothetical protein